MHRPVPVMFLVLIFFFNFFLRVYFLSETCQASFDSLLRLWIFNNVADPQQENALLFFLILTQPV